MTGGVLTLRPLFITRIAMFGVVLLVLTVLLFEVNSGSSEREPVFESTGDVTSFALVVGLLLVASWRNWRLGIRLSPSEITVLGLFRDRTVARTEVVDVTFTGHLAWESMDGRIRLTPIVAFMGSGLAGVVVRHNERNLALLRSELAGTAAADYVDSMEEDRGFDSPSYRRPRRREGPPKHAGRKRHRRDTLLAVAMVAGHVIATALAVWLVIEPALWLARITETPGLLRMIYSNEPYSRSDAMELLLPHIVLAGFLIIMTVRLLYFVFRPRR